MNQNQSFSILSPIKQLCNFRLPDARARFGSPEHNRAVQQYHLWGDTLRVRVSTALNVLLECCFQRLECY